ncbi:MAG TPA: hypothetical protein VFH27_09515 [Longimicrobiaceae bacterium]|nr:hypothetical protein [Longimicrobiaceae bacterium]
MKRTLLTACLAVLTGCGVSPTEIGLGSDTIYRLEAYNGQELPTAKACGGTALVSGSIVTTSAHKAERHLELRDLATGHVTTTSIPGTYTRSGTEVAFTFQEPTGSWTVHGTFKSGHLELTYPAPCDGYEVESYAPALVAL